MNGLNDIQWDNLKEAALSGNIVPIIGPDALLVEYEGETIPFYRLIARDLLTRFKLEADEELLQQTWCLPQAVLQILRSPIVDPTKKKTEQSIRNEIKYLIKQYSQSVQPAQSLRLLANIPTFNLYVNLTPDKLLQQAMQQSDASLPVRTIEFSPRSASETIADLSLLKSGERTVFQMLGPYDNDAVSFAIHEENILEYCYHLQTEAARRFINILSEVRRRNKLFINCNFPDWLGRSLLRLVNNDRLYTSEKSLHEFLCPQVDDQDLRVFLTQYSESTVAFEGKVEELIAQLASFCGEKKLSIPSTNLPSFSPVSAMRNNGPTAFVSYHSANRDVVLLIVEVLMQLGFSDVWLDQKKIIAGDNWSDCIEDAIEKCDFFLPILSKEADNMRKGVFWYEWELAIKRSRSIKDAFLIPICIDSEFPKTENYKRISFGDTKKFFGAHLLHCPLGEMNLSSRNSIQERCHLFNEMNIHD